MRARPTAAALAAVVALLPAAARAEKSDRCIAASEAGQQQRDRGALVEARASFRTCATDDCPAMIRKDCARWLEDVEQGLPTVVLGARDARGADVLGVRVFVDGARVSQAESGRALPLDPGPHVFRFESPPSAPVEQTVVLRMGEHNRPILVTLTPPPPPPPEQKPAPPAARISPWALVAGGVGVVGLGAFAYFGISGLDEKARLRSTCSPACTDDQVSGLRARYIAADVSLGVGIVALGIAGYLWLRPGAPASPAAAPSTTAPSTTITVAPTRSGATLGLVHLF